LSALCTREVTRDGKLGPMGGFGKIVEADETFVGTIEGVKAASKRNGRTRAEPLIRTSC
jgi:hypothetical protein